MEWLNSLSTWVWGALAMLAGLAVFVQFAIPLGNWFWAFAETNALTLIALSVLGGVFAHAHKNSS